MFCVVFKINFVAELLIRILLAILGTLSTVHHGSRRSGVQELTAPYDTRIYLAPLQMLYSYLYCTECTSFVAMKSI